MAVLSLYDTSVEDTGNKGANNDGINDEVANDNSLDDGFTNDESGEGCTGARINGVAYTGPKDKGANNDGIDDEAANSNSLYTTVLPTMSPAKGALVPVPIGRHTPDPRKTWRLPRPMPLLGGPRSTKQWAAKSTRMAMLGMAGTDSVTVWLGLKPP